MTHQCRYINNYVSCNHRQVAREHVGENILAIDAVLGKVAEVNRSKFGYVAASFLTRRMQAVVRDDVTADTAVYKDGDIVPVGGATIFLVMSELKTIYMKFSQSS